MSEVATAPNRDAEVEKLIGHIRQKQSTIDNAERLLKTACTEMLRLRRNLFGIQSSQEKQGDYKSEIARLDRTAVERISRRYTTITIDDMVDNDQLRDARAEYAEKGHIEIDEDALVSVDPDFKDCVWVQAWVRIKPKPNREPENKKPEASMPFL